MIRDLIRELRKAAYRAKRTRDRTGRFDTTTVYFALPAHVALIVANRLEQTEDRILAAAKARTDMQQVADIAEESLKDTVLRFEYAAFELENLLADFFGRQPMTRQEIRDQRTISEVRPSPGPQPFVRTPAGIQASPSLRQSIRNMRIGNPREPGEEG